LSPSNFLSEQKFVLIGGGTGSAVFLRTLKKHTKNITAIVTVADDGGSSGFIRQSFGIAAPGDIRNCIVALADDESVIASLMDVRFDEPNFRAHSFGNILLAAMYKLTQNFPLAVKRVCEVLAITGKVLPVTTENVTLKAYISNGRVVSGESRIPQYCANTGSRIVKVAVEPEGAEIYEECAMEIEKADAIVICPGSLYTSIIPSLAVKGMREAIQKSKASKYWVMNIMTQRGETEGFTLSDHVKALESHCGRCADSILYSTSSISPAILRSYELENACPVVLDAGERPLAGYRLIGLDIARDVGGYVRHDSEAVFERVAEDLFHKKYAAQQAIRPDWRR
jgi:uncharacterized cofD-like protein